MASRSPYYRNVKAGFTSAGDPNRGGKMAVCGLTEEELKCFLCREHYTLPKQLPCMHSFCSQCLEDYVASTFRQTKSVRFPCPVCASATEPPDPEHHRTPGEFVKDYNDDYLTDALRHLDLTSPKGQELESGSDERCLRHPDYVVDHFCNTCKKTLCGACQRDHVTCAVEQLQGKDPKQLRKVCTQEIMINVTTMKNDLKATQNSIVPKSKQILTDKETTSAQITAFFEEERKKVLQSLQEQEAALQKELSRISVKKEGAVLDIQDLCNSLITALETQENILQALGSKQAEQETTEIAAIQVLGEMLAQLEEVKRRISIINETINTSSPTFEVDKEENKYNAKIGRIVSDDRSEKPQLQPPSMGKSLTAPEATIRSQSPVPVDAPATYHPKVTDVQEIPTQPPLQHGSLRYSFQPHEIEDARVSSVVGLAWYLDNILVLDRFNTRMGIYRGGKLLNSIVFSDEPWDVAIITDADDFGTCMVTVPKAKKLYKIQIENETGKTDIVAERKTTFGYTCLTCNPEEENLVCGCCSPFAAPQVHIVDFYGRRLKQFALDSNFKPIFSYPRSVDVTKYGVIVVCDWNINALIFMTTEGNVISQYKGTFQHPLKDPMGTTLDDRGHVLVADRKSRTIHIVTLSGQFVGVIKTDFGLVDPREIAVNAKCGMVQLAVSNEAVRSALGSAVQVFELAETPLEGASDGLSAETKF